MKTEHQREYAMKMAQDDKTCEHGLQKHKCKECNKKAEEPDKEEGKESKKEGKKIVKDEEKKEKYPEFRRNSRGKLNKIEK